MHTAVGDIDLAYNTLGEATDPPVVLISGLGAQLIAWDDAFCQQLVDRGLFVIRFDNRDVGLSSHLADRPRSDPSAETAGAAPAASYTLAQMAADTAGLIDNLGLGSAHVVGISLGGMIAQILAIEHPERVRSMTSIMSTTGHNQVGQPTDAARALFLLPPVITRESAIDRAVLFNRTAGSPAYPTDETELRPSGACLRPRVQSAGRRAPTDGGHDYTRPNRRPAPARPADPCHSRRCGPGHCRERRAGDRRSDPRSGAGRDRRYGSRPAPTAVADRSRAHCRIGRTRAAAIKIHRCASVT
jgi:pimeloyl-ACP methyl ester carboxylesterase